MRHFLVTLFFLILVFTGTNARPKAACNGDYSPCECSQNTPIVDGSAYVVCFMVSVEDVERIFATTVETEIDTLKWTLPIQPNIVIPPNLLDNKHVQILTLNCVSPTNSLTIDTDAFRSSQDVTYNFGVKGCDFANQADYSFLNDFSNLSSIHLDSMTNVPSIAKFPPSLPKLYYLEVYKTSGLEEIGTSTVPSLSYPSLQTVDLLNDGLTDRAVDQFLNAIYPSAVNSLEVLNLGSNLLTRVPAQVPLLFPLMIDLSMNGNKIQQITSPIYFSGRVQSFFLADNGLTYIPPGTFKGNYTGASVGLYRNNLTVFEAEVFKSVLEDMVKLPPYQSRLDIYSNPFDCDGCGLAWLIRDNPDLLFPVKLAECSNLTTFEELDPNGYRGCP